MFDLVTRFARRFFGGEYFLLFGRFRFFRRGYGRVKGLLQRLGSKPPNAARSAATQASLFDDLSVGDCVREIERNGVYIGLQLAEDIAAEIRDFAARAPCSRPGFDESFRLEEVEAGHLPDGRPVPMADVRDVSACPVIDEVAHDPALLRVARGYMGFWPDHVVQRLFWSLASDLPSEVRREASQPIDFHYDVDGYCFLNVYFYLTPTSASSGSHVVVRGSHARKALSFLFTSRFQPDRKILEYYGDADRVVIEGDSGFGFVEDPSIFHKPLAPSSAHRLVLQIRYQALDRRLEEPYLAASP